MGLLNLRKKKDEKSIPLLITVKLLFQQHRKQNLLMTIVQKFTTIFAVLKCWDLAVCLVTLFMRIHNT